MEVLIGVHADEVLTDVFRHDLSVLAEDERAFLIKTIGKEIKSPVFVEITVCLVLDAPFASRHLN